METTSEWQAHFRESTPKLDVHWWNDPDVAAEDVFQAIVYRPDPGWLARRQRLRRQPGCQERPGSEPRHRRGFQLDLLPGTSLPILVAALAGGGELVLPPQERRLKTAEQVNSSAAPPLHAMGWRTALRLIEGEGVDYRS